MTLMKREWRPESTIYLHFYALFMTDTVRVRRESERARARERERERQKTNDRGLDSNPGLLP